MAAIVDAEPGLEGIVFDVPEALGPPPDRCRAVAGDSFSSVPSGADAYVLKQVLHDWPDERADAILRSCRAAMRPGARLLILERGCSPSGVTADDLQPLLVDLAVRLRRDRGRRGVRFRRGVTPTPS